MEDLQVLAADDQRFRTQEEWRRRYADEGPVRAAGSLVHSERGNRLFYRVKENAIDRCMRAAGATLAGKDVLDAAGGSGQFVGYFLGRGARTVTVADFCPDAVQEAERRYAGNGSVRALAADITQPFGSPEDRYDWILIMEAIFLLPTDDDLRKSLSNLAQKLRPGGFLVISDLFPEATVTASSYVTYRSRSLFESTLASLGVTPLAYLPQTILFNRRVFGPAQKAVEYMGPLLYHLDRLAMAMRFQAPARLNMKYLIARASSERTACEPALR